MKKKKTVVLINKKIDGIIKEKKLLWQSRVLHNKKSVEYMLILKRVHALRNKITDMTLQKIFSRTKKKEIEMKE